MNKKLRGLSEKFDADIYLLSGEINPINIDKIIFQAREIPPYKQRTNAILILSTFGGSADDAYRLVRYFQSHYKKKFLYLFGYCKSAGTLIAIGFDEIVFSDFGELGPLDVQLSKDDELTNTSALCYYQSLRVLRSQVFSNFEEHFLSLKRKSAGNITTKTAAEIASKLAVGIISPISAQIEPLKLGEVDRANRIAEQYGNRIFDNNEIIQNLIVNYPSHEFVIDLEETKSLFKGSKKCVRKANEEEKALESTILSLVRVPCEEDKQIAECVYNRIKEEAEKAEEGKNGNERDENVGRAVEKTGQNLNGASPKNGEGVETIENKN